MKRIGIIICDRYHTCAGGKCLRSMRYREGAFAIYKEEEIDIVGYTTCGGCPGGNIEYAPAEMKKNGADVIHLATGLVVGYPPCPHLETFCQFIPLKYGLDVVVCWPRLWPLLCENVRNDLMAASSARFRQPHLVTPITSPMFSLS